MLAEALLVVTIVLSALSEVKDLLVQRGKYLRDGWNVLDILNILLFVVAGGTWLVYQATGAKFSPEVNYKVYDDLRSQGNFLKYSTKGLTEVLAIFDEAIGVADLFGPSKKYDRCAVLLGRKYNMLRLK